ncbi:MAG: hypothetical protein H7Y88_06485, partial [Phycisphaerales bacterium]|nr:hypothetical protein [Phycisphaerales bacterium]
MDQLRNILATIQKQLGRLTGTHRLLIASLAVIAIMSLFLVTQYAGKPSWVPLMPGSPPEDVARAKEFLAVQQVAFKEGDGGELLVRPADRTSLTARLQLAGKMPADTTVMFKSIAESQNWMMSKGQLDQVYQRAVMNELCSIIREFPGVRDARVIIDSPAQAGFGPSHKKPTAQVTVFTEPGKYLDQSSVDALASLVAGSTAGLEPRAVQIIDGDKGRGYKVRAGDGLMDAGGTYMEQVAKVEQRVQEKIENQLAFIGGVVVSVNAHVDVGQSQSRIQKVLPNKAGSEVFVVKEKTNTSDSSQGTRGAAPGVLANTAMDVNSGGGGAGNRTTQEDAETTIEPAIGREETTTVDPKGKPTKIYVAVSVPRDWAVRVAQQKKGGAAVGATPTDPAASATGEPTEAEIQTAWAEEQVRLTKMLLPMVEAPSNGDEKGVTAESVVVSLIPVAVPGFGGGGSGGGA